MGQRVDDRLTSRSELIAFVGAYVFGEFIIESINSNVVPWLIQNGHEDRITLASWAVSLAVMLVVLFLFLMTRRFLGGSIVHPGADY